MRSLIIIAGLFCFNLYAVDNLTIPQMVESQCMNCHGDRTMLNTPMLPGQNKEFLMFEINNFRNYLRVDETMNQVMENFTDKEVKEIAEYISGLSQCRAEALVDDHSGTNLKNGKKIFKASCIECHSKSNKGIGPVIHAQKTWYLENAIKSFQSTWHEPRPSRYNMRSHTDMLSEQDIKDVAAYLNKQRLCD